MKKRFLTALMVATAIGGFVGNANAEDIFTAMRVIREAKISDKLSTIEDKTARESV